MKKFLKQDRPKKVKEIYKALKRDHPNMPAGKKAAIAHSTYEKISEVLKGGLADKSKPEDFDASELKLGIKIEMEHTDDPKIAREIAMDHLKEHPMYYSALKKMESKLEKIGKAIKPIEVTDKLLDKYPNVLQTKLAYIEKRKNGKYYLKNKKGTHGVDRENALSKLERSMYKDYIS